MKRNVDRPESSDEESKASLKKAKKEKYGKRKQSESDSSETDDRSNRADSGCQSVQDNDCDRNVKDGTDGSGKEEIGEINLSSVLDFMEEVSNTDSDAGSYATADGSTCTERKIFCCVKSAKNCLLEDVDDGVNRSPCSCPRGQDRNDESDRNDSGAGSSKGIGKNDHSRQPHFLGETYAIELKFESCETAPGDAFIERGESQDYDDGDISSEFHSSDEAFIASDLNVANFEIVQGDGSFDSDHSEEFHSFGSRSRDLNVGNDQIAENEELLNNSFGSFHTEDFLSSEESSSDDQSSEDSLVAENDELIRREDRADADGEEDSCDEADESSDLSDWTGSSYTSSDDNDEGYTTADNVFFPDPERADEDFSEQSDSGIN